MAATTGLASALELPASHNSTLNSGMNCLKPLDTYQYLSCLGTNGFGSKVGLAVASGGAVIVGMTLGGVAVTVSVIVAVVVAVALSGVGGVAVAEGSLEGVVVAVLVIGALASGAVGDAAASVTVTVTTVVGGRGVAVDNALPLTGSPGF